MQGKQVSVLGESGAAWRRGFEDRGVGDSGVGDRGVIEMDSADAQRGNPGRHADVPVERRRAEDLPYAAFLRDYVAGNHPVVIEGAASGWPAVRKWTPDYFKTRFGSKPVNVSYKETMPFADFIDGVLASTDTTPGPYMYRLFICIHLPELLEDLDDSNPYGFARRLASPLMPRRWRRPDGFLKLLIGGVGGRFPVMHYDGENMHAAISEIYGDKEFILYPPEDTPYLYPKQDMPNQTRIEDIGNPDPDKYPLFAKATRHRTVLKPGDTIFVPSRWWHTARVLSPSVSVCTNQLDTTNWDGFVREVCQPMFGGSWVKRETKRALLKSLGPVLSVFEKLGRGRAKRDDGFSARIGRMAPWSPAQAADAQEWPIGNWTVDSG